MGEAPLFEMIQKGEYPELLHYYGINATYFQVKSSTGTSRHVTVRPNNRITFIILLI